MTAPQDRPNISERYGVAVATGGGRVAENENSGDVILAAAMQRHALGAMLLRLQSEYDSVRAELERAGEISARHEQDARRLERRGEEGVGLATALRQRTESEALTARCLILTHLKTLRRARIELGTYAILAAARRNYRVPNGVLIRLASRVLDIWLDPICAACDGTGWTGSAYEGKETTQCRHCGGSGHRRDRLADDDRSRWFAFLLLGDVQRTVAFAASGMKNKLRPASKA